MKGLELSEQYYETYGKAMLREEFPELLPDLAAGLTGSGSECFGYDDETSRDHDFEPGFCLFLPDEDIVDRRTAFRLERAYAKLPKEFMGLRRSLVQPVGGARHGVLRISDYFEEKPVQVFLLVKQLSHRLRETTRNYQEACRTVAETVDAEQKGEERSGGLKKKLRFFADVYRGFVNGEKAD